MFLTVDNSGLGWSAIPWTDPVVTKRCTDSDDFGTFAKGSSPYGRCNLEKWPIVS